MSAALRKIFKRVKASIRNGFYCAPSPALRGVQYSDQCYASSVFSLLHVCFPISFLQALFYLAVILGTVLLLIGIGLTVGALYNKRIWPLREAAWQRSFLCKRCGGIFLVPSYDPIGVNPVSSRRISKGELLPRVQTEQERHRVEGKAFDFDEAVTRKKHQGFWRRFKVSWKDI